MWELLVGEIELVVGGEERVGGRVGKKKLEKGLKSLKFWLIVGH